jgi:hypothetical protein
MVAPPQHVALTRVNVHAPAVATVRRTAGSARVITERPPE